MRAVGLMPGGLDNEVRRGLTLFGWVFTAGAWRRSDFVFTLEQCLVSSHWGRISHHIRESIRSHHFASLHRCKRHEFVQQEIPLMSDERLKLVRKLIRNDSAAMMLAIGAIRPAASRAIYGNHMLKFNVPNVMLAKRIVIEC